VQVRKAGRRQTVPTALASRFAPEVGCRDRRQPLPSPRLHDGLQWYNFVGEFVGMPPPDSWRTIYEALMLPREEWSEKPASNACAAESVRDFWLAAKASRGMARMRDWDCDDMICRRAATDGGTQW